MKTRILWAVAALVLLAGCQKSFRSGQPVNFNASLHESAPTKTVYGDPVASGGTQAINWSSADKIAIYSSNASIAATEGDASSATYVVAVDGSDATKAKLSSSDGLNWKSDSGNLTFYGVYPYDTPATSTVGQYTMTIPQNQTGLTLSDCGFMVSKTTFNSSDENVLMEFYPAFTAFEIHVKNSEAADITLKRFAIKTESSSYLTGKYLTDWTGSSMTYTHNPSSETDVVFKEAYTTLNTTVSDTQEAVITLFLMPSNSDISNLFLEVQYEKGGEARTRKLQLKQSGSYIPFASCKKHVINALAVDSEDFWSLSISGNVLDWSGEERSIEQSVSISGKVNILHSIETTDSWKTAHGNSSNHYFDTNWVEQGTTGYGEGSNNYAKNYQIRTLNRDLPLSDRYFTITFTPSAPVGGYWQLIPQYKAGDTQSPRHFRFERSVPGGGKSADLYGQILTSQETIKIYPVDWDPSDVNTYSVWFTCLFSTSPTFANSINADTEFQDVHSDGRFSYWVFRLQQYQGQYE